MIERFDRLTPEALLMASARGDERAFAELYAAFAPWVHGLACRILRDAHLAEEVTQEVFRQVWQSSGAFDPARGSALAWVMTVAHRRAVDRVRSEGAGRRRDAAHADDESRLMSYDETSTVTLAPIEAESVRAALADLTAAQRRALELAYFEGYTHLEISNLMECPAGTAKGRIHDGLARLRASLVVTLPEPA